MCISTYIIHTASSALVFVLHVISVSSISSTILLYVYPLSFLTFSVLYFFFLMSRRPTRSTRTHTLFPSTTLFRSHTAGAGGDGRAARSPDRGECGGARNRSCPRYDGRAGSGARSRSPDPRCRTGCRSRRAGEARPLVAAPLRADHRPRSPRRPHAGYHQGRAPLWRPLRSPYTSHPTPPGGGAGPGG